MLNFIAIGSGSSGNCYYLSNGTDSLLIDLGVGINTLKRCSREDHIDFTRIPCILITHDHSDHIKLVGRISADYHIPVYSNHEIHIFHEWHHFLKSIIESLKIEFVLDCPVHNFQQLLVFH